MHPRSTSALRSPRIRFALTHDPALRADAPLPFAPLSTRCVLHAHAPPSLTLSSHNILPLTRDFPPPHFRRPPRLDRRRGQGHPPPRGDARHEELVADRDPPARHVRGAGPHRQAVPRTVAQPPRPDHQQGPVVGRGGGQAGGGPPRPGQQVVGDLEDAAGAHGQLD